MQDTFSNALSEAASKHIALSPARRETLARLARLIMRRNLEPIKVSACCAFATCCRGGFEGPAGRAKILAGATQISMRI
ncbi:MAG: hypothetical protein ACT4O2_08085 [Beijerinckiaceae bacterium]